MRKLVGLNGIEKNAELARLNEWSVFVGVAIADVAPGVIDGTLLRESFHRALHAKRLAGMRMAWTDLCEWVADLDEPFGGEIRARFRKKFGLEMPMK